MNDYPDITAYFSTLKNNVYDWVAQQQRPVPPVQLINAFAENGPFDVRPQPFFPSSGEYARLNGQIVSAEELNHVLFGMATVASGYGPDNPYQPESYPPHLTQAKKVAEGSNNFYGLDTQPEQTSAYQNSVILKGVVSKTSMEAPSGKVALAVMVAAVGAAMAALLARKFRGQQQETSYTGPHPFEGGDIRSVGNNPPARLPLHKSPLQLLQAPTLANETSKAYQQVLQNLNNRPDLPVGKTRNARGGYVENPLILNQNRIIDVDTTPQYLQQPNPYTQPDVDPRLLRQQAYERLQAAHQQLAQIVQPPKPRLPGRAVYQSTAFNDLRASQQQAQARELQRLQLEQLRQQLGPNHLPRNANQPPLNQIEQLQQYEAFRQKQVSEARQRAQTYDWQNEPATEEELSKFAADLIVYLTEAKAIKLAADIPIIASAIDSFIEQSHIAAKAMMQRSQPGFVRIGNSLIPYKDLPDDVLKQFENASKVKPKSFVQGGGAMRRRRESGKYIFEEDKMHGTIEVYNKKGEHLGELDPLTGKQTKPAKPGRKTER